jgi:DNA invertase Pin-like site-specific DNA recombinase
MDDITKNQSTSLKLFGAIRVSKQDLAEGYGPAIQEAELVAYARTNGYDLVALRHVTEPATADLEDRQLFQAVISEAIQLKRSGQCDGVVFSRCDRLSRQMEGAIQVALDLRKAGLAIHLVRENQVLQPNDPSINFLVFVVQAFGVDTQTRIFLANTRAGQRKAAQDGKLPSGVGRGLYGYNLIGPRGEKRFEPNTKVWIVDEALRLGIIGTSINEITRELRLKEANITRDTVRKILKHAKVYAGVYRWGGLDIPGLVPPRITLEQAQIIEVNMHRNKEQSYGWGKRKWLTGRVRCGLCGASYALELGKKGCHCRRSNPLETLKPCPAPKIPYAKLELIVWHLLMGNIGRPKVLTERIEEFRVSMQKELEELEREAEKLKDQLRRLKEKKERLLWQHAEGWLKDDELKQAIKALEPDLNYIGQRIEQLQPVSVPPKLLDPGQAAALASAWKALCFESGFKATEEQKTKIAEAHELQVTIYPADNAQLRLRIWAKIPLTIDELEINKGEVRAIVGPSPRRRSAPFLSG